MTEQVSLTHVQFLDQYEGEKLRRLVEDLRRVQQRVNSLIEEVNQLRGGGAELQHVLATTEGLGPQHTVSGLTANFVLKATSPTDAAFAPFNLDDVSNVAAAAPNEGDELRYLSGQWRSNPPSGFSALTDPGQFALVAWDESTNMLDWAFLSSSLTIAGGFLTVVTSGIDHNTLGNLTAGDPHTQYPLRTDAETIAGDWVFTARLRVAAEGEAYLDLRDPLQAAGLKQWRLSSEGDLVESLVSDDELTLTDARRVVRTDETVIADTIVGNDAQQFHTFRGTVRLPDLERRLTLGASNELYLTHNGTYGRLHCYGQLFIDWQGGMMAGGDDELDFQTPALKHNGVDVLTDGVQLRYVNTIIPAGNTVASTASETAFESSHTFSANAFDVGDVIRVKLYGTYGTDALLAPSLRTKLKLGGATLLDTTAVTTVVGLNNVGWWIEGIFVVHSIGASGSVDAQGFAEFGTGITMGLNVHIANAATVAIDTTTTLAFTVTVQWGTADADNTITLRQMVIERL